jgi:predicted lipoprotein with Yx(FWY)xxD motif
MNQPHPANAMSRRRGRLPRQRARRLVVPAVLLLGLLVAGCGSSKPAAPGPPATSSSAAAPSQTTQTTPTANARAQQAKRVAAARRARLAAAHRAAHARAVKLQAARAASARAARAQAARKRAAQAAAGKHAKTTPATTTTPTPAGTPVSVKRTRLGSVLVNALGRTLYLFAKDPPGQSACPSPCAAVWPPLTTTATPSAGPGAVQSELGTTRRPGGVLQVTYHGHPLYLFVGDAHVGQTAGEGLNQFGGLWWAVSPAGAKVVK